jgi:hypothetical protein
VKFFFSTQKIVVLNFKVTVSITAYNCPIKINKSMNKSITRRGPLFDIFLKSRNFFILRIFIGF